MFLKSPHYFCGFVYLLLWSWPKNNSSRKPKGECGAVEEGNRGSKVRRQKVLERGSMLLGVIETRKLMWQMRVGKTKYRNPSLK